MERFGIIRRAGGYGVLVHNWLGSVWVFADHDEAIELRDLLLKEFPVEPAQAEPTPEPDPDQVRRALEKDMWRGCEPDEIVAAAARAYLRMREQQPTPAGCDVPDCDGLVVARLCGEHAPRSADKQPTPAVPTIAQVVEACGARDNEAIQLWRHGGSWSVNYNGTTESAATPEAALAKLYTDAVKRLRQQRDEADAKLRKLEAES